MPSTSNMGVIGLGVPLLTDTGTMPGRVPPAKKFSTIDGSSEIERVTIKECQHSFCKAWGIGNSIEEEKLETQSQ